MTGTSREVIATSGSGDVVVGGAVTTTSSDRKHRRRGERSSSSKNSGDGVSKASSHSNSTGSHSRKRESASGSSKRRSGSRNSDEKNNQNNKPYNNDDDDNDDNNDNADRFDENELFHIVTTETAHERMRKISTITDPGEPNYGVVAITETAHDRMRKMSKLGLEDPVDVALDNIHISSHNNNNDISNSNAAAGEQSDSEDKKPKTRTAAIRKSEKERSAAAAAIPGNVVVATAANAGSRPHRPSGLRSAQRLNKVGPYEEPSSSSNNDKLVKTALDDRVLTKSTPSRDRTRRTKSDDSKYLGLYTDIQNAENNEQPVIVTRKKTGRGRSVDKHKSLVIANMRKQQQQQQQFFEEIGIKPSRKKALEPLTDKAPPATSANGAPVVIGEVIAPTGEQRQLMRKISALGLEDPVFGDVHADMAINHASMIFEDMNLEDLPDDMRDMLSVVSDRTDSVHMVDDGILNSSPSTGLRSSPSPPVPLHPNKPKSMPNFNNSMSSFPLVLEPDFEPPVGSFIRRESNRNLGKDSSNRNLQPSTSPVASPKQTRKAIITPPPTQARPTMTRSSNHVNNNNTSTTTNNNNDGPYVPPSGSFRLRKPRIKTTAPVQTPTTGTANTSAQRRAPAPAAAAIGNNTNHSAAQKIPKETLMQSIERAKRLKQEREMLKQASVSLGKSMPDLFNNSFNCGDSMDDSIKPKSLRSATSHEKKIIHKKPPSSMMLRKNGSIREVPHEDYIPPPAPPELASTPVPTTPLSGLQHRALPSMEFCFTPTRGVHRKTPLEQQQQQQQQQKLPQHSRKIPPSGVHRGLQKGLSSRSCDDDFGLEDSPVHGRPPLIQK